MIVLNFNTNINGYIEKFVELYKNIMRSLTCGSIICPECDGLLKFNCKYPRHPMESDGTKHHIEIIQVQCEFCGRCHSLIPDFLMPHKHYNTETIEMAVSFDIIDIDCIVDNSTIYRWKKQFVERGTKALAQICMILWELYQKTIIAIKLANLPLIKRLSLCVTELGEAEPTTILGAVNVILTRANIGFL